eukprot:gene24581-32014_t
MLNNIINTAPDPIFVKDEQHRYMYVNQAFSEALGYPALELLGKSDVDFFPKHETDIFYKIDRKTFKSEITTINEETFTGSVYGTRIISTKKSVFRTLTGNKILVGVIRDITELTEARESLKKYAQELKRQVNIRTKQLETKKNDLEHAVEKLKSLNSDLDCFAHMCCHELREPLRTISSFSKLAMDEYLSGENKNICHFLQTIHDRTLKMDRLIKSILKYSTNGLNTNAMSSFPLYDLITEVLTMLDSQIEEKKAVINFDTLPTIYADRLQILQLFQNLINNAIKFCAPSHSPVIHIYAKPKKEFIEFKIKDNGIGIDKKYHKEIFLPFKKFHSQSEGSMHGIGLSLCKKIIENHGGSIKMYSEKNAEYDDLSNISPIITNRDSIMNPTSGNKMPLLYPSVYFTQNWHSKKRLSRLVNSNINDTRKNFKIAIVGGGGAGTIITALLSNVSQYSEDVRFDITLFEKNPRLINGSTFETAAVLHAGGREYSNDMQTASHCQMTGELFERMFPDLYTDQDHPIVFAVNSDSSLTTDIQKKTHDHAKQLTSNLRNNSTESSYIDSQNEIPKETIQTIFSSNLAGGVLSKRDKLMNIFKRNILLKKYVSVAENITIRVNTSVSRIFKNDAGCFEIINNNGLRYKTQFDQVILTAWDQIDIILKASSVREHTLTDFCEFTAEDRVIALCDIRHIAPLYKTTPIFTLTGGAMFIPLNDDVGIAYRCIEEGSYPTSGEKEIPSEKVLQHGQVIVDELKNIFQRNNGSREPFESIKLLGARRQKVVRKSNSSLDKRHYEPPMVTPEGIIVALPPKATFIGSMALQTFEQLLMRLPDSCKTFKEQWIQEIKKIVPNDNCLYTGVRLPDVFMIRTRDEITQKDIINETLCYFESCCLNQNGKKMSETYQEQSESMSPPNVLKRFQTIGASHTERLSTSVKRSVSDPLNKSNTSTPSKKSNISLIDLKISANKKSQMCCSKILNNFTPQAIMQMQDPLTSAKFYKNKLLQQVI